MQTTKLILIFAFALILAACGTTKKVTTATTAPTDTNTSAPTPNTGNPFPLVQPTDGSPAPGNEELTAIQVQYKEVTLEKLKEGHEIYTAGACINCHGAANIYHFVTSN